MHFHPIHIDDFCSQSMPSFVWGRNVLLMDVELWFGVRFTRNSAHPSLVLLESYLGIWRVILICQYSTKLQRLHPHKDCNGLGLAELKTKLYIAACILQIIIVMFSNYVLAYRYTIVHELNCYSYNCIIFFNSWRWVLHH